MNAQEHLDEAERQLTLATSSGHAWDAQTALGAAFLAIGHALVALAIETGAPHPVTPGGPSGPS